MSFSNGESLNDMIEFWKDYFFEFGKPSSIYVDKYSTYKVNHPNDLFDDEKLLNILLKKM